MNDLIRKAQKGNKKAREELYKNTVDELSYFCSRLYKNKEDADDLLQETYLTAFQKLDQYRTDKNFRGWLHTIALHKYCNQIRSEKQWTEDAADTTEESELYAPENYAERRELQNILMDTIENSLNEPQKATVLLYYYDDMSVPQIAEQMNCPEGTVKTRLYHSRRILREELIKKGISLTGSVALVSAVLKTQAVGFRASAASLAAVGSSIGKKAASDTAKSVAAYAKGKIIAGAAAAAVAVGGGVAAYNAANKDDKQPESSQPTAAVHTVEATEKSEISGVPTIRFTAPPPIATKIPASTEPPTEAPTERPTGISVPGGELKEYDLLVEKMKISVPENYDPSYEGLPQGVGSASDRRTEAENDLKDEQKSTLPISSHFPLCFRPDEFSGDCIGIKSVNKDTAEEFLNSSFEDVSITNTQDINITLINPNADPSETTKSAKKYTFTASEDGYNFNGILVAFKHMGATDTAIVFQDFSGIRQEEYESVINSIILSVPDNSWMDNYDIPDEYRH